MIKLEEFKAKADFTEDKTIPYPGLSDKNLLPIVTEKINLSLKILKQWQQKKPLLTKTIWTKLKSDLTVQTDI